MNDPTAATSTALLRCYCLFRDCVIVVFVQVPEQLHVIHILINLGQQAVHCLRGDSHFKKPDRAVSSLGAGILPRNSQEIAWLKRYKMCG